MKKYSVFVLFKNGRPVEIETDTNLKMVMPVEINGGKFLITEDQIVLNADQIDIINIYENN
ncbi:hypothetical protein [Bacillus niameyensis]|uniref:hypothetical protein n=1 Tax=Bacillus niameyensis TaxID=1522308 RepID=UPI000781E138|nr:hypothetical protein [Bacillus niameyensis]